MSRVPLPRFSNLSAGTPTPRGSALGVPQATEAPTTWEGLFKSAEELKEIRRSTFSILEKNKQGFVSLNLRPALLEIQKELERSAVRQFGLLGRLSLMKATPEECGHDILPLPSMVLAFAVHSAILNAGFVCTGSGSDDFSESENWPNCLPPGWLDDTGSKFSFKYRARSGASDRLIWKGVVMTDLLAISANDPYSSGKDAMTMHLRIKDFVKSKAGEPPALIESKELELNSVVEDRILPIGMTKKSSSVTSASASSEQFHTGQPANSRPSLMVPQSGHVPGGFNGDLIPGGGGSMLFGPGNPQFDHRFRPQDPRNFDPRSGGRIPEARFDPYGPFGSNQGDPDPDELPIPGHRPNFPSGPVGPGHRSFQDYL